MAFRGKEMMTRDSNAGAEREAQGLSKVVIGRAKRGLYAGRHIQYGNRVSEDGGNKSVFFSFSFPFPLSLSQSVLCVFVFLVFALELVMLLLYMKHLRRSWVVVEMESGFGSRRCWKPNVQEKRLFSYIFDRHIKVKVTTHALRCIDKAGGIDEYLLKTPYQKMDTEMGLFWKTKVEQRYAELGQMEVAFFNPEDEAKFEQRVKRPEYC
ncbi:hypothetical protein DY000_02010177 [Brassica cretica]|uniref:Ribosomal protein L28 n=1 Tax=Brassica cretica TaxID=69181 RepID=A0ABQ7CGX7_BRACR|nr:hypothetical protein DY000_02010177 [Brassica cretica]